MIEHCPIDRDSLDVHFCGSPSAHVELMRTLEQFHAWFTRDLRQPARLPLPHFPPLNALVVDHGPEFMSDQCEFALAQLAEAQLTKRVGGEHE